MALVKIITIKIKREVYENKGTVFENALECGFLGKRSFSLDCERAKSKILENADVIAANYTRPGFVHNQTATRVIKNSKDSLPGTKIYHQIYFFDGSVNGRLNSTCEPGPFNGFILELKRRRFRKTYY